MRWTASALLLLAATTAAGPIKLKEPGPKAKGKRYEWKASNGGLYLSSPKSRMVPAPAGK